MNNFPNDFQHTLNEAVKPQPQNGQPPLDQKLIRHFK